MKLFIDRLTHRINHWLRKILSNLESSLTHVYLVGGYTYNITNLLKFGKQAVVQEKDFTDPRGNKVVPVENHDSALLQGYFFGTTECNLNSASRPVGYFTDEDMKNVLAHMKDDKIHKNWGIMEYKWWSRFTS